MSTKILVIEDCEPTAFLMRKILQDHGYDVVIAHTVADAMDVIPAADFIFLDINLGLEDGREVLRRMIAKEIYKPIAVFTGAGPFDVAELISLGVKRVIEKPVDFDQFTKAVLNSVDDGEGLTLGSVCVNIRQVGPMVDKAIEAIEMCMTAKASSKILKAQGEA